MLGGIAQDQRQPGEVPGPLDQIVVDARLDRVEGRPLVGLAQQQDHRDAQPARAQDAQDLGRGSVAGPLVEQHGVERLGGEPIQAVAEREGAFEDESRAVTLQVMAHALDVGGMAPEVQDPGRPAVGAGGAGRDRGGRFSDQLRSLDCPRGGVSAPADSPGGVPATGTVTVNVVPPERVLRKLTDPPWSSTILCTRASPSPVPLGFVVKNGLKTWRAWSVGMPTPVSAISTTTRR
jgi:hypothetical protein